MLAAFVKDRELAKPPKNMKGNHGTFTKRITLCFKFDKSDRLNLRHLKT